MTRLSLFATLTLCTLALAADPLKFGTVSDAKAVKLSVLLEKPDDYVGKTVKVEGLVTDVCSKRGCWLKLGGDQEFQTITFKVDDGVISFPMSVKGHRAEAEGVFTKLETTKEQALARARHDAEEKGEAEAQRFGPIAVADREVMVAELVDKLKLPGLPKDSFRSRPDSLELFYDRWTVKADATAGLAVVERPRERPVLRQFNFLHLNHAKHLWTWVADAFALVLIFLAVGGALIPRGRKGLAGHGKYFVLLGLAIPLGFVLALS